MACNRFIRAAIAAVWGCAVLSAPGAGAQPTTPFYVLDGATRDAKLGAYVAAVPDVTGDGIDELVSGNHRYDGKAGVDSGRVLLFNGPNGWLLWTFEGEKAGGLLGHDVGGIRDVNGDGRGDVLASAYRFDTTAGKQVGRVYCLSGKSGALIWKRDGEKGGDEFGYALGSVPDLDGDKVEDVVVGAWTNDERARNAGKVYLLSGRTGVVIRTHLGRRAEDRFGCSAAGLRDLDGDGFGDYAVGAWNAGPNHEGQVYLHSGRTGKRIATFTGERATDLFGIHVASVPDTNGDGVAELLVGARDHDVNGKERDAGRAYLYSGKTRTLLYTLDGERAWDKFGRFGAGIPDLDGDGRGDLVVGAYNHSGPALASGAAYLYSGRTGRRLRKYVGEGTYSMFGFACCGLNDVNGDGRGDVVIGAYQYRHNPARTESYGRLYAYTDGLTSPLTTVSAAHPRDIALHVNPGKANAMRPYLMALSLSGTRPGFHVGRLYVPLVFDPAVVFSVKNANILFLINTLGKTDSNGKAVATVKGFRWLLNAYVGLKVSFAYALVDKLDMVSNAVTVEIRP